MMGSRFYYEFYNPAKVTAGKGCLTEAAEKLSSLGLHNAFFVCDRLENNKAAEDVYKAVNAAKIKSGATYVCEDKMVRLASLRDMRDVYRANNCDCIVACGSYGVINAAKTLRMLLSGQVVRFEDVKGINAARKKVNVPLVAVPTDIGTSNVASNGVTVKDDDGAVFECLSPLCIPDYCIIDPKLVSVRDADAPIAGALESFVKNIEEFVSRQAVTLTKCMNLIAIREVRDNFMKAADDPTDELAVFGLQKAGLLAGICYSGASAGIAHAISGALASVTGRERYICTGIIFAECMRYNLEVAEKDYAQAYYYIVGDDRYAATPAGERAEALISAAETMIKEKFGAKKLATRLSDIGADEELLDKIVEETMKSYALVTNPRNVTKEDVSAILRSVM